MLGFVNIIDFGVRIGTGTPSSTQLRGRLFNVKFYFFQLLPPKRAKRYYSVERVFH